MPAFQLLRCQVALGGDQGNQVYRDRTRPIVFPELPILQYLHGEEAVTEIYAVGTWDTPNDEVLTRINTIYAPEVVQAVFPGARPRLPLSDAAIPRCNMPVYKPRSPKPANPDPRLRPLDQFTTLTDLQEAPELPDEDVPTADEIAAHAQDDDDAMGLVLEQERAIPSPGGLPHVVRDTHNRGSSRRASAAREPATLPDVNAGGSHGPDFADTSQGVRR